MEKQSRVRRQQMNRPPADPVKAIASDAPAEVQSLLRKLRSRESQIDQWFQEDPERMESLRRDPQKTIEELLKTMKLERPRDVEWGRIQGWEFGVYQAKPPPVGSALLRATWQYANQSPVNLARFKSDPFSVINDVATATGASADERAAVTSAFEAVTGTYHLVHGPIQSLSKNAGPIDLPLGARRTSLP